ncbi:MAG: MBL fold metallo-hydrolase [Oscillospiraceae bacterium]|nr:MBL fold metallo-hydrolase [Oscillospiraceae bacterium]
MSENRPQMQFEAIKIDEGTYRIEEGGVRCMLFIGSDTVLLVDTGFGRAGSLREFVSTLTDKPVTLILSHADGDHIGGALDFGSVTMHPSEMFRFFREDRPAPAVTAIWEGDIIDIGGRCFEVVFIPGHTPGSIALLDRENRIIVTGDSLSAGPIYMFGDGRNIHAYIASMEKLAIMKSEFDEVYPSHGAFPLPADHIDKSITVAKMVLAGEIEPNEPAMPIPAKQYMLDGVGFLY